MFNYIIMRHGQQFKQHKDEASAINEARRLSAKEGQPFCIYKPVIVVRPVTPKIEETNVTSFNAECHDDDKESLFQAEKR